jgi:multidrug resistance efflux pump
VNRNSIPETDLKASEILKIILRLGHESFRKGDLISAAVHMLNNSRIVLKYDRTSLVNIKGKFSRIIATSNQSEVNHNSEYSTELLTLTKGLSNIDKTTVLDTKTVSEITSDAGTITSFEYFSRNNITAVLVPLPRPDSSEHDQKFFWIIEFFGNFNQNNLNLIHLLSLHYSESIWYYSMNRENILAKLLNKRKHFSPKRILLYIILIFIVASFFKVSQNVVADFELIPHDETIEYAPYSGTVDKVMYRNGQKINKGEVILQYDTQELYYKLMESKTRYDEISAELDWIKQKSFSDKSQLGRVKVLALKQQAQKIEIEKNQWYLDKAKIKADISGTLVLNDSEKWEGKAVKAGEELFEIVPPKKINAEVQLNENNASVLGDKTQISLYLHSQPESPLNGKIISVSPKPMLTKTGQFCYIIKMRLNKIEPGFIVGMRGVARVSGEKVSIGYYLFKSLVLWWRKI